MYANKNTVGDSVVDALGMGVGFTLTLFVMASIREIFGSGAWFGMAIPFLQNFKISIMTLAPGGFFVFGCLIAVVNRIMMKKGKPRRSLGCKSCPCAEACGKASCETEGKGAEA